MLVKERNIEEVPSLQKTIKSSWQAEQFNQETTDPLPQNVIDCIQLEASHDVFCSIIKSLPANSPYLSISVIKKKIRSLSPCGQNFQDLGSLSNLDLKKAYLKRHKNVSDTKSYISTIPGGVLPLSVNCSRFAPPEFSLDGRYLRYVDQKNFLRITDLQTAPTSTQTISLADSRQPRLFLPRNFVFSPDSMVAISAEGHQHLYFDGSRYAFFEGPKCLDVPKKNGFSPNSKYFVSPDVGVFQIRNDAKIETGEINIDTRKKVSIKPPEVIKCEGFDFYPDSPRFSRDSRYLRVFNFGTSKNTIFDMEGESKPVEITKNFGDFLCFTPDSKSFVLIKRSFELATEWYTIRDLSDPSRVSMKWETHLQGSGMELSLDGRFAVNYKSKIYSYADDTNSSKQYLDIWDLSNKTSALKIENDFSADCCAHFSGDSRFLLGTTVDGNPAYADLHQETKVIRSLSNPFLSDAGLDKECLTAFAPEANRAILRSKDYLRLVDISLNSFLEIPLWVSSAARQALAADSRPEMTNFLQKSNTSSDYSLSFIHPPVLSRDGLFLVNSLKEGIKIWDVEGDLLS